MAEVLEAGKALITIQAESVLAIFTKDDGVEPILAELKKRIDDFRPGSISTKKGRDEIKANAFSIAKSRTYLEKLGKSLADEQKLIPKKIDAARRKIETTLEMWEAEVRAPLTEWEDAEKARIDQHTKSLEEIAAMGDTAKAAENAAELRFMLAELETWTFGAACEEFEEEYRIAVRRSTELVKVALAAREQYDADQAELARLRQAEAERQAAEAKERAAREAQEAKDRQEREEAARIAAAAEKAAQAERDRANAELAKREADTERERVAGERREAELKAQAAAAAREAERREAQFKAETEAAEQRARDTEFRIKAEQEAARLAEAEATRKREADRAHRGTVNRAAVTAFVAGGLSEAVAKIAVELIAKKMIPNIIISY